MKILAWAILIFAVIWVLRSKAKAKAKSPSARPEAPPRPTSLAEPEVMVSCTHCGVHFPASEAVCDEQLGMVFCSIEHRQQHLGTRA